MIFEFGIFVFCFFVPITIVSLTKNKTSRLKIRETDEFNLKIQEMPDIQYEPVTEGDVELLKRRENTPVRIITVTIMMDVLTILGMRGVLKDSSQNFREVLLVLLIVGVLSAISIGKSVKTLKRFKHIDGFQKIPGCIFKYKEQHFPNPRWKYKGTSLFQVLVGYKDEHGTPVVVRDTIPEMFFRAIKNNSSCQVILENGEPVTIIPGEKDTRVSSFSAEIPLENMSGKKITILIAIWMMLQCMLNLALEFSWWNAFSLLFSLALFYMFHLCVSKTNYLMAFFLLVYEVMCIVSGVQGYIAFYIVQGILDVACAIVISFAPSVRAHFAKL